MFIRTVKIFRGLPRGGFNPERNSLVSINDVVMSNHIYLLVADDTNRNTILNATVCRWP